MDISDIPRPLQNIISKYVNTDLIELGYNILDRLPLNRKAITINDDYFIDSFIQIAVELLEEYKNHNNIDYLVNYLAYFTFNIFVEIGPLEIGDEGDESLILYLASKTRDVITKYIKNT